MTDERATSEAVVGGTVEVVQIPSDARLRKGQRRREMIINAAIGLFRSHGFHATSIDDIGQAAGITGPGVYRHFDSKHGLLAAILERGLELQEEAVERARAAGPDPLDALTRLVESAVDVLLANRSIAALYFREIPHLPQEDRLDLTRKHGRLVDQWTDFFLAVRTDLTRAQARIAVWAVGGLINSVVFFDVNAPPEQVRPLLVNLALGAIRNHKAS